MTQGINKPLFTASLWFVKPFAWPGKRHNYYQNAEQLRLCIIYRNDTARKNKMSLF